MDYSAQDKCILIVDLQEYWRTISADALIRRGYDVCVLSDYDYSPASANCHGKPPDLVILGCASIGSEEQEFIKKVMADKRHLVVLSTSLPWADMRSLFLAGADDVADKSYDPGHIVNIVEEAFENVSTRRKRENPDE
jgi:DNA-binding response OmpR family regulator